MRFSDPVPPRAVVHVFLLLALTIVLLLVARGLHRPGLALGMWGAYFAIRLAVSWWQRRRRAERAS